MMNTKLKRRVAQVDALYKIALDIAGPVEKKLLMKAHSNLDQMLSAGRDLNIKLLCRLGDKQTRMFAKIDDILAKIETEED
jgi:hypothetical protein